MNKKTKKKPVERKTVKKSCTQRKRTAGPTKALKKTPKSEAKKNAGNTAVVAAVPKTAAQSATSISFTPNKIALTQKSSKSKNGSFAQNEKRTYYPNNENNRKVVSQAVQGRKLKKVTYNF